MFRAFRHWGRRFKSQLEKFEGEKFAIVNVKRGLIEDVEAFANEESALELEQVWRKELNPDYDDVGVFGVAVQNPEEES